MGLFDSILIGFLVVTVITIAATTMMTDFETNYEDVGLDLEDASDEFTDVYNTMSEIQNITDEVQENLDREVDADESEAGAISSLTKGAYSAIRLIPKTFSFFGQITFAMAKTLHIDCNTDDSQGVCNVINIALIAFMLIVLFAILYMIFRFIPRA